MAQRTAEIGVRMALGASPADVAGLIVRPSRSAGGGWSGIGLGLAMFLDRYFSSVLYGVRPRDPATLAGASLVLLAAAVATAWPAYRAAKTDPVEALREAALRPAEPGSDFTRLFAWFHLTALEAGRRMAPASRANRKVRLLGRLTVQTDIRLMCKVKSLLSETIALEKGNPRPNGNPSFSGSRGST